MIIFKKIKWQNFLSTGNIPIEIDLNSHNNTLFLGINGSGKSTLLCALTYVLFNKSFRHINKPQLINTITKRNLLVEIEFSIGSITYIIKRGMNSVVFEIYRDGTLLNSASDSRDYQQFLEKNILKTNYKSFCQVVILGSATYKSFMRLDAAQKRGIIEDLLDLEVFMLMNIKLKEKILNNNNKFEKISSKKRNFEEKIRILQEHINFVNSNNEESIKEYNQRNVEIDYEIFELKKIIKDYEDSIKVLNEKIKDEILLEEKLKKIIAYKHKMENNLSSLYKENKFFETHDVCPTCSQDIHHGFKLQMSEDKKLKIETIQTGIELLINKISEIENKLSKIKEIKSQITDCKFYIQHHEIKINSFEHQKKNNISVIENISKKDSVVLDNIDEIKELLKNCKKDYYECEEQKSLYSVANDILKDNGIKSQIIKQYIPIINRFIGKYLSDLEFFGTFELDENFKETIKSRYRDIFDFNSFSQGERFRIDIAILFAWREIAKYRNSFSTNLLIMDEVFDGPLDDEGIDCLFKFLNNLKGINIFIITPKGDSIAEKFNRVIVFKKDKNFSRIES